MRKNKLFRLFVFISLLLLTLSLLNYNVVTQAQSSLTVQIRASGTETNQSTPFVYLVRNSGTSAVSGISIRIYFTIDGSNAGSGYVLEKYFDQSGVATVSAPTQSSGSTWYFTVNYGTASLAAGASWEFQTALHLVSWGTTYDGSNDWYHSGYAVGALPAAFTTTANIPAYVNGTRVSGSEPGGSTVPTNTPVSATATRASTTVPTATRVSTQPPTQSTGSQVFQAEQAVLGGGSFVESSNSGFIGSGYVNSSATGGSIQFNGVSGTGASVTLTFRHALGVTSSRTGLLIINGASQSITFQPTGSWTTWANHSVNVTLNSSTGNTIRLETNGQDLANVDQLTVGAPGTNPTVTRTPTRTSTGIVPSNTPTRTPTRTSTGVVPTSTPTQMPTQGTSNTLYVAPNGTDSAPGTLTQPTTLASAITRITAGGTIFMRGGTYSYSTGITIARGNNGTSSARKQLFAYQSEVPVLNFAGQATDSANRGLTVNGHYWYLRGLVVERAGDNGIFVGGNNNIIERCITRFNRDTGLQLGRHSSSAAFAEWPANNLIISCESHDNMDPTGENADGFAAKLTTGPGNIFRYDVAHHNSDDGWDLYTKSDTGAIGPVTVEDSIAYRNGTLSDGTQLSAGDRNGFKLGGEDIAVNHTVRRNLAYDNGKHGFTYNRNLGTIAMSSNVSKDNDERNFNFDGGTSTFSGNISCRNGSGTNDRIIGTDQGNNTWWMGSNGAACSAYNGTSFSWHFNADGSLSYDFQ